MPNALQQKRYICYLFLCYQLQSMYQEIRNLTGDKERSGLNMPLLRSIKVCNPNIIEQNEINQSIVATQRKKPDEDVDNDVADVIDRIADVAGVLSGIALLIASSPIALAAGAVYGIAKGIAKLFRRKRK